MVTAVGLVKDSTHPTSPHHRHGNRGGPRKRLDPPYQTTKPPNHQTTKPATSNLHAELSSQLCPRRDVLLHACHSGSPTDSDECDRAALLAARYSRGQTQASVHSFCDCCFAGPPSRCVETASRRQRLFTALVAD